VDIPKYFTQIVPGGPSVEGFKRKRAGVDKYSDFAPIEGYISETAH